MVPGGWAYRPVRRAPLSLLVARQLREAIVQGELADGSELGSEKELSEQFGVSRPTVREALRVLQAQGLLSGGDTVSTARPRVSGERTRATAAEALENAVLMGRVELADLVELRLVLEGAAVRTAAPSSPAFAAARAALEQMRAPDIDVDAFHDADVRFHECLGSAGGNAMIPLIMAVLHDAVAAHLLEALRSFDDPRPVLDAIVAEHTAILDAIERGDHGAAAAALHDHIQVFYSQHATKGD